MDLTTGLLLGVGLFVLILVPYLVLELRKGKAHGRSWFTRFKPRGHSDLGPDPVAKLTDPRVDEPRGVRH